MAYGIPMPAVMSENKFGTSLPLKLCYMSQTVSALIVLDFVKPSEFLLYRRIYQAHSHKNFSQCMRWPACYCKRNCVCRVQWKTMAI